MDLGAYDNVVIAVNKKELVSEYLRSIADAGTVLMFAGLAREETVAVDAYSVHYREVSLTGTSGYAIGHFREALGLVGEHPDIFSRVITHRMPLEKGREAFGLLAEGRAFKIILKP